MVNHIKYYHNYSNSALLDCFSSASLLLNMTDGELINYINYINYKF